MIKHKVGGAISANVSRLCLVRDYGKPVQSDFERTSVRLNSDHVLWKKGDLDVISLSENMTYNYKTKSGIGIGNQYSNDISNFVS